MKQEDLFCAIGGLDSLRLAKTEEDLSMKSGMKLTRRLLIAAVVSLTIFILNGAPEQKGGSKK